METKISNQNGKVVLQVPQSRVAFTTDEAFKLMKLLKKHIKEADEYTRTKRKQKELEQSLIKRQK